jgi:hypothetical protein
VGTHLPRRYNDVAHRKNPNLPKIHPISSGLTPLFTEQGGSSNSVSIPTTLVNPPVPISPLEHVTVDHFTDIHSQTLYRDPTKHPT